MSFRLKACGSMTTLLDHKTTLAYLAYLGYPDEPRTSALQVTRSRKIDRRKGKVSRNVFLCYVCGAAGSGKTSLLRAFAGQQYTDTYGPTAKIYSVVNSVEIDGAEKYLVASWRCIMLRYFCLSSHRCKSLGASMRLKCSKVQKRQIWSMS